MKTTLVQVTRDFIALTTADYEKKQTGGFSAALKNGAESRITFGPTTIIELTETLKDNPIKSTAEFASYVKNCAKQYDIDVSNVHICLEDDNLISKEYQHAPAKQKFLATFAKMEAESVVPDDINLYSVISYEYGLPYGKKSADTLNASLFAANTKFVEELKNNFERLGMIVEKITPPVVGMLHACKTHINTSNRVVAVVSIDYVTIRLVIMQNGAPIFQQCFQNVLGDIAGILADDIGISFNEAIELIKKEGIGVEEQCQFPQSIRQIQSFLDNAAAEVVRNLRMVLSSERAELDQIYVADSLGALPGLEKYCRQLGISTPITSIDSAFSSPSFVPVLAPQAMSAGFTPASYFTFNGILNITNPQVGNLLNSMSLTEKKVRSIGKYVTPILGVALAGWILVTCGLWVFYYFRESSDNKKLALDKYKYAQEILKNIEDYTKRIQDINVDKAMLPSEYLYMEDVFNTAVAQIEEDKTVKSVSSYYFNNASDTVDIVLDIGSVEEVVDLKNKVRDLGYFVMSSAMEGFKMQDEDKNNSNNDKAPTESNKKDDDNYSWTITLQVTDETRAAAKQAYIEANRA